MTRKLTGLEILAVVVVSLLVLFALVMFVVAIVTSASPSVRAAEGVSVGKAWTAALVASVLASSTARLLFTHLERAFPKGRP